MAAKTQLVTINNWKRYTTQEMSLGDKGEVDPSHGTSDILWINAGLGYSWPATTTVEASSSNSKERQVVWPQQQCRLDYDYLRNKNDYRQCSA